MPRYKKKRHSRFLNPPKKRVVNTNLKEKEEKIPMKPFRKLKAKTPSQKNMRVVTGKKLERSRKVKILLSAVAVIAAILMILEAVLPAGIIQTVSNLTALIGTGSYPITVSGSQTLNVVPMGNYYFVLTDTSFAAYSNGGKKLISEPHGFEKPILSVSEGRAMVYNLGGNKAHIFDLRSIKKTVETKNKIISASISDSGRYAIATYSDKYAGSIYVYDKGHEVIYEWYSAKDSVNNVAISSNGKKIAVATFNTASGLFDSKINIINYNSATPEHTFSYDDTFIYGLYSSGTSGFSVIKPNGVDYVDWSDYEKIEYKNDYTISKFRSLSSVNVAVFCRESDKTDNKIVVLSKDGEVETTVKYNGVINDIQVKGSSIYCISDTDITVLDFKGKISRNSVYGFGGKGIAVTAANTVAIIFDNEIEKIKLQEKE